MFVTKLSAALIASTLAIAAVPSQASAASQLTEAFLANVRPNVAFLDGSSKLAMTRSQSAPARAYARDEAIETTKVADATDALVTGRSAAIAGLGQAANGRAPIGQKELTQLASLSGKSFDDAYWEKQLDALSQLAADYRAYAAAGDDKALVRLAKRELPRVEARLKALSAI